MDGGSDLKPAGEGSQEPRGGIGMSRIEGLSPEAMKELERNIQLKTRSCATFEEAAQRYTSLMYEAFEESLVLIRLFATVPFGKLPGRNQQSVRTLASSAGITDLIKDDTLVLSLVGSSGVEPEWNDRRKSQSHVGIPLASGDFIDAIPMMSRLLRQLGVSLEWIDRADTTLVVKTVGGASGVFFVKDASVEVDNQGRRIIAAQDFVEKYGVKSVFGIGGGFLSTPTFLVSIVFCRDEINREAAQSFMPQVNRIKVNCNELVNKGLIFSD